MILIRPTRLVLVFGLTVLGCKSSTSPNRTFTLRVVGSVRDSASRSIVAAMVAVTRVEVGSSGGSQIGRCSGFLEAPVLASTQNDGKYAATLVVAGKPEIVCIAVQVTPLAGTGLRPATVSADSVFIGPPPFGPDSIVMDVRLSG